MWHSRSKPSVMTVTELIPTKKSRWNYTNFRTDIKLSILREEGFTLIPSCHGLWFFLFISIRFEDSMIYFESSWEYILSHQSMAS